MKMNFVPGLLLLAATAAFAEPPEAIQRVTLDERAVVTVPVSTNHVTTISFSGPIAAIDAVGVTADGKTPGQFQLAHTKGSSFLSVRALASRAATNLTIRWNKRTYVFELVESDAPVLALNLEDRAASEVVQPAPQVTPTRLLALLDKASACALATGSITSRSATHPAGSRRHGSPGHGANRPASRTHRASCQARPRRKLLRCNPGIGPNLRMASTCALVP